MKKPSMTFSSEQTENRGFQFALFFNDLKSSKMSAHPRAGCSQSKNCVLLKAAK